jgi:hypothetical protein
VIVPLRSQNSIYRLQRRLLFPHRFHCSSDFHRLR